MSPHPPSSAAPAAAPTGHVSTIEAARMLGLAVRSVQLMVDRGQLQAWRTPGGHRRIDPRSVERLLVLREASDAGPAPHHTPGQTLPRVTRRPEVSLDQEDGPQAAGRKASALRLLLIEDSGHFQNLVGLLVSKHLPEAELHIADDGIAGLAMAGKLEPDVLLVDIALPGIDGATLITSLRSHPQFRGSQLIVVTGLDDEELAPYAFALNGVPVVRKPQLVSELPPLLAGLHARERLAAAL